MKKFAAFLLLSLVFASCETEKESLEFIDYSVGRYYEDCRPENGNCTFISLTYPVATNKTDQAKKINQAINDRIIRIVDYSEEISAESPEELADDFITDYKNTRAKFPDTEIPWEASVNAAVSYSGDKLISVRINSELFTGGAHGYAATGFLNFNPETGDKYEHSNIFREDFIDLVEKAFREKKEISEEKAINSTGLFFEDDKFHLPNNIGFTEEKVIVIYNPYEVAAYAEGAIRLEFTRKEVAAYLKEKFQ